MALHPLNGIELFSGVGMLGEGLRAGLAHLGIPYRAVCHVEREAHAGGVMVARMEEGSMDAAPVWSDVTSFDAAAWRGKVDCVVAGFPCQDLSVAGRRAGLDGKRSGLFFEVVRIAADSGARFMLLENVAGIASATATVMDEAEGELDERAASRVVGELADCGWDAEWITLSASDVGASHGRARWFCLAWRQVGHTGRDAGSAEHGEQPESASGRAGESGQAGCLREVADPARHERDGSGDGQGGRGRGICEAGVAMADADRDGLGTSRERQGRTPNAPLRHQELFAPGPADPRWAGIIRDEPWLAPALSIEGELDAAAAFAAAQSILCGTPDGLAAGLDFNHRAQRLKCVGNGVVALCAAAAVVVLVRRAGITKGGRLT